MYDTKYIKLIINKITEQALACYKATGKVPNVAYVDLRLYYYIVHYCHGGPIYMDMYKPFPINFYGEPPGIIDEHKINVALRIKAYDAGCSVDSDIVYVTCEEN